MTAASADHRLRAVLTSAGAAVLLAGCSNVGIGIGIPIGRGGSIGVGGTVDLPRPAEPPPRPADPAASTPPP